ncbi:DUF2029 domain-containing protein [Rhodobacteraceae bacterium D3-12]|nr:DUF2029 domain-containing protein [Rhodobacteraceae bacterium D3-12]
MTPRTTKLLFIALAVLWAMWIIQSCFNGPHIDISALYMAGWMVANGQSELIYLAPSHIFNAEPMPLWDEVMTAQGQDAQVVTAYVYPPIWAALLAVPAHAMSAATFFKATFLLHVAGALASAFLAFTLTPHRQHPTPMHQGLIAFAVLFFSFPAFNAFLNNQPQITVTFLILAAMWLVSREQSIRGGALLGLAIAIKVSPILFALIFVMRRDWRALGAALAVSGGIALTSLLVMGWPLHAQFLEQLSKINAMIVMTKLNFSPEALLFQASEFFRAAAMPDGRALAVYTAPEPLWITVLSKAALILALVFFWRGGRRIDPATALPVQLLLLSLIAALLGPLSWAHYFFMPLLLLPALFVIMPPKQAWGWIVLTLLVSSVKTFSLLHSFNDHFMLTALVPALLFFALLLRALFAVQKPAAHP